VLGPTRGKAGILGLLKAMVRWRVGLVWYAAALLLPVGSLKGKAKSRCTDFRRFTY
jgi:hypothetical protein